MIEPTKLLTLARKIQNASREAKVAFDAVVASDAKQMLLDLKNLVESHPSDEAIRCFESFSALYSSMKALDEGPYRAVLLAALELVLAAFEDCLAVVGPERREEMNETIKLFRAAIEAREELD